MKCEVGGPAAWRREVGSQRPSGWRREVDKIKRILKLIFFFLYIL
jgi:hypothetical protein